MKKTVSLSKYLGVTRKLLEKEGVFDAILGIDTKLFIDPKLLISTSIPELKDSRNKILKYFSDLIKIHRQSEKSSQLRNIARERVAVSEPEGLSIGYGNKSDKGTSVAKSTANRILLSASEILAVGIEDPAIIELLNLFVDGFGPDSISDLTAHIIYSDLCNYTQRVSKSLNLTVENFQIENTKYKLPKHPFKNSQIIFIPTEVLRPLPVVSSWEQISMAAQHNQQLRRELSSIVFPVLKESLTEITTKSKEDQERIKSGIGKLLDVYNKISISPYNLLEDEKGYYGISPFIDEESSKLQARTQPKDQNELIDSVRDLIKQFQRGIEQNGGNKLLYKKNVTGIPQKDKPHREDVAQIIFYLIADIYCQQANILLARESNAGRGPVDFSLGKGYKTKVLVEIKKSNNPELENGFKKQIVAYQNSENALYSFYVVIKVKPEKDRSKNQRYISPTEKLQIIYQENKEKGVFCPELFIVDGLIYPSASKLRK